MDSNLTRPFGAFWAFGKNLPPLGGEEGEGLLRGEDFPGVLGFLGDFTPLRGDKLSYPLIYTPLGVFLTFSSQGDLVISRS